MKIRSWYGRYGSVVPRGMVLDAKVLRTAWQRKDKQIFSMDHLLEFRLPLNGYFLRKLILVFWRVTYILFILVYVSKWTESTNKINSKFYHQIWVSLIENAINDSAFCKFCKMYSQNLFFTYNLHNFLRLWCVVVQ